MPSTFPLLFAQAAREGSNAAIISFAIYTAAVFAVAAASNRLMKSKSFLSEYFLGSRGLGVWAFALTFAATSSSGGSFMGFPSKVYTHGWSLALWIGSYMLVPVVAMGLIGKRLNQVARKAEARFDSGYCRKEHRKDDPESDAGRNNGFRRNRENFCRRIA